MSLNIFFWEQLGTHADGCNARGCPFFKIFFGWFYAARDHQVHEGEGSQNIFDESRPADAPGRENFYQIASGFQSIADFRYGATARGVRNAAPIAEPSHFRIEVRRYYEICA